MTFYDPPGPHCSYRLFEWTMAIMLTLFGLHLLLLSDALSTSRLSFALVLLPKWFMTMACLVVGVGRSIALFANGRWPVNGSRVRMASAFVSGLIVAQFGMALLQASWPTPTPAIWIYFSLVTAEARTIWRARFDGA